MMTDFEIVQEIAQGQFRNFEVLYQRHHTKFLGLALRIMRDPEAAEEVLQESFLKLVQKAHQFRGDAKFTTWFYFVVSSTAFGHLRIQKKRKERTPLFESYMKVAYPESYEMDLQGKEISGKIQECLGRIPERYRGVFYLRYGKDLTTGEIADLLGIRESTVKPMLHRAKKMLRKHLKRHGITSSAYVSNG